MTSSLVFSTFSILVILLLRVCSIHSQDNVFDVTSFGSISGGAHDITKALSKGWSEACGTENGVVLIPRGSFLLNTVKLAGPCNGSTTFLLNGHLKAPANVSIMKNSKDWVLFSNILGLSIVGNGSFDGQGKSAWLLNECKRKLHCKSLPMSISLKNITNGLIQGIVSTNSKFFHLTIRNSDSILIKSVTIQAPHKSPNTDGIHISQSKRISIYDSNIGTGDDCISLSKGSRNIYIYNVTCGPGHGISIGSLGKHENEEDVSGIVVRNCTFTNTTNGARIKTWAPSFSSRVFNLVYEDIILNNVSNPILIDQHYCPNSHCMGEGESSVKISHIKFINFRGTSQDKVAVTLDCSSFLPCDDIVLKGLNISLNNGGPTIANCTNFHGIFYESKSPLPCISEVVPTPTPTPTGEIVPTPTPTGEIVPTPTPTPTGEIVPTPTPTPTSEIVPTPTPTGEIVPTPTPTPTTEIVPTPTPTAPTPTPTGEIVPTPTPTGEIVPTSTPTNEIVPTPTPTGEIIPTPTPTPTNEIVPTPTPFGEIVPAPTPTGEIVPTPTPTDEIVPTSTPTNEIVPTPTPTGEIIPTPTPEIVPTPTPFGEIVPTPTPISEIVPPPTPIGEIVPTPTPTPTSEIVPTPAPTSEIVPPPTPIGEIVQTPTSEIIPTPTPTSEIVPPPTPTPNGDTVRNPTPTSEIVPTPTPNGDTVPNPTPTSETVPTPTGETTPTPTGDTVPNPTSEIVPTPTPTNRMDIFFAENFYDFYSFL
nr:exopolygalacturonase-like [Ipomoea batatas]